MKSEFDLAAEIRQIRTELVQMNKRYERFVQRLKGGGIAVIGSAAILAATILMTQDGNGVSLRTKDGGGNLQDRVVVTKDIDVSRVRIQKSHMWLEKADAATTAQIRFYDLDTNYIGFQSPANATVNQIWTLPADNATGFLKNTGGTLAWVPASASGAIVTINSIAPDGAGNFTIAGTGNQITVTGGANSITLSTPQNIDTAASVTFGSLATSGDVTVNGNATIGNAGTDTITFNAKAASGLNMDSNVITNIGAAGTGFSAGGSLTLGNALSVSGTSSLGVTNVSGAATFGGAATFNGSSSFNGVTSFNAQTRFVETGGGTDYVALQAPGSVTSSVVWTLPSTDGSPGYFLTTNGAGLLSWSNSLPTSTSLPFNQITTGTNTGAAMTVDSGASILLAGTGIVEASRFKAGGSSNAVDLDSAEVAGTLTVGKGGTGLSASGGAGNYLRSDGTVWVSSALQAGDLPSDGYASTYVNVTGDTMTGNLVVGDASGTDRLSFGASGILQIGTYNPVGAEAAGDIRYDTGVLKYWDGGQWVTLSTGGGTVTSVGLSVTGPLFTISGSPVTGSGTLTATINTQVANRVFAGPASGADAAPTFRLLVADDMPSGIDAAKIGGGAVSNTEFGYLDGVTSAIQTQLDAKVASVAAGNSTITIGGTAANPTVAINLGNANTWTGAQTFATAVATDDTLKMVPANVGAGSFLGTLTNADLSAARTWTLPDTGGTIALTSQLTGGTVTSVGLSITGPLYTISGSPVTGSGTLTATINTQVANRVFAGPASGADAAPTFRLLVADDMPSGIDAAKIGGGVVSNTEFGYLDGVTSAIQTQLNAKVASVAAGNSTITIGGTATDPTVAINLGNANTWTGAQTFATAVATDDTLKMVPANVGAGSFLGTLTNADLTAARTWTLPNADGTLALTSQLTGGTVTSVGLSMPGIFSVSGSPVTTSGTLTATLNTQVANTIFAGPSSGADAAPTFRALAATDMPSGIDAAKIGGGAVSNTEFGYLDGVTSAIQTQLNAKVASVAAGNSTITIGGTATDPTVAINLANANTWTGAQTFATAVATDDTLKMAPANVGGASFLGTLTNADLTAARTWTLPNASGTIALTSDIPAGGTPALTLSTSNAAGAASTYIRTDATIAIFDATVPSALGSASAGSASFAARADHVHAAINLSTGGGATYSGTLPIGNGGTGTSTAFTAGSVVFAGGSGVYTQDNANLFWDDSSNRLGIGTAAPSYALDVNGAVNIPATQGYRIGGTILLQTMNTARVTLVGEGAGTSLNGADNTFVGYNSGSSNTTGSKNTYMGSMSGGAATITRAAAIGYNAQVTASSSLVLGGTGVDAVKVGIGTTAPNAYLHVAPSGAEAVQIDRYGAGAGQTGELRFVDIGASNYTGFKAPDAVGAASVIYTLPTNFPAANGYALTSSTTGVLTWTNVGGTGTVTSVGLTMPTGFSVANSPVTTSGTLAVTTTLNGVIHGDGSGFTAGNVALGSEVSGTLPIANGGTNSGTALSGSSIMISNGSAIVQGTAGTTTTVLHGNAAGSPTYSSIVNGDLASGSFTNITGVGTLTAGTWNATTIAVQYGGTGATTLTSNGVLLGNGTSAITAATGGAGTILTGTAGAPAFSATPTLGVDAATTGQLLLANGGASGTSVTIQNNGATAAYNFNLPTSAGTSGQLLASGGGGATAMTWTTLSSSTVTSFSAGTTGLTPNSATTGAITLAGTLVVANGGTGATTLTGMLKGNGTSAFSAVTGTANYNAYWTDANTIAAEQYTAVSRGGTGLGGTPSNGQLLIGNGAGYTLATLTGTANQVIVTNGAGSITLSTPQNIDTAATPQFSRMGLGAAANADTGITVAGATINAQADGTIAGSSIAGTFTKNDATVKTFSVEKIKPTFNFGASDAGTTVNILEIDSTNTNVTGLTANLIKASYGGSQKMLLDSAGNLTLAGNLTYTGVLPIANGGTNSGTALSGSSIMISNGSAIIQGTAGTTTTVLHGNAAGVPTYSSIVNADLASGSFTNITGVGTLTAGTWNATTIGVIYGGTGLTSFAQGDILYASAANTLSALAKNTTATRYLSNTGASNNPAWAQVDLSNGITGTLPVANGGTGQTSYTDGQLLIGNSTGNTLTKAALAGTANQVIVTNGSGSITLSTPQDIATSSTPQFSRMGLGAAANADTGITVAGAIINAQADGTIAGSSIAGTFTKNDATVKTFSVEKIKPTFNFGASDAGTTVNILEIDSTNTNVTGLTANLIKASYGGTQQFLVTSGGVADAATGFRVNGGAASGNYLRGNGTNFVSSAIQAGDIPSGSGNYIQNQSASAQSSSSFWVSGTGRTDGDFTLGSGTMLTPASTSMNLQSPVNVIVKIDHDNSSTGDVFAVRTNGVATNIFEVSEGGDIRTLGSDLTNAFGANTQSLRLRSNANVFIDLDANADTSDTFEVRSDTTAVFRVNESGQVTLGTWQGTAIANTYGGTGQNSSGWTGVPSVSSGTWSVNAQLPVSLGGTGTGTQFTQGSVVFAGASGVYSQNNANFFWDDTNARLGIGTASPGAKLEVSIASAAVTASSYGQKISNANTNTTTDSIDKYGIYVTTSGSFTGGAGAATNSYGLYIGDLSQGDNGFKIALVGNEDTTNGVNRANLLLKDTSAGGQSWTVNSFGSASAEGVGKFGINQVGTGNRFIIDSNGYVGIATTSPGIQTQAGRGYLTISGSTLAGIVELSTAQADADGNRVGGVQFADKNSTGADKRVGFIGSSLSGATGNNRGGLLDFYTKEDNANALKLRMVVSNTGNVGIGTGTPTSLFTVSQPTAGSGTVTTNATTTLTGTGTTFTNSFKVGDTITVSGETVRTIASIVSDTSLTVTVAFATSASGLTYTLGGGNRFSVQGNGLVAVGSSTPNELLTVDGVASFLETSAPSLTANYGKVYVKSSDSKLYFMNDSGAEFDLTAAGSGANTALSNLASVAINTSLLPGTSNSIDLGSNTKYWRKLFLGEQSEAIEYYNSTFGFRTWLNFTVPTGSDKSITFPNATGWIALASGGTSSLTQYGVMYASTSSVMSSTAAGTSTTVLHGNASGAPTWSAVSLTADVSGTLPIGNGGTGVTTTPANGQLLIGNGSGYTVANLTAGTGIAVTNGAGSITLGLSYSTADPGSNPGLNANEAAFGSNGIIFEGATADTSEGKLTVAALGADQTWTLPNSSGTIALTSDIPTAYWSRTGTELYPNTAGDRIKVDGVSSGTYAMYGQYGTVCKGYVGYYDGASLGAGLYGIYEGAATSGRYGVYGSNSSTGAAASAIGVYGIASASTGAAVNYGVYGIAQTAAVTNYGVYGNASNTGGVTARIGVVGLSGATSVSPTAVNAGVAAFANGTDYLYYGYHSTSTADTAIFALGTAVGGASTKFSIDSDGDVTTGSWKATAVAVGYGGTGLTSITSNNLIIGNGASAVSLLAPGATTGTFLRNTAAGAPSWSTLVLPNTAATGDILYASSSNTIGNLAAQIDGRVLVSGATPSYSSNPTLGETGVVTGSISLLGFTSGTVAIRPQSAAGSYNFNLPTAAGSSGQPLLSGGGGATAMSFGTLGVAGGGTGATTLTGMLKGNGAGAFTAVTGTANYATYWTDANTIAAEQYLNVSRGGTGTGALTQGSVVFAGASGVYTQDNSNFFWDNTNKRLALGFASPAARLDARTTFTSATTGEQYGEFVTADYSVADTGLKQGIRVNALSSHAAGTQANVIGILSLAYKSSTGDVTNAYGLWTRIDNLNATGTIANAYGLYISDSGETGNITNDWGVYQVDTGAGNYFGGSVAIGTTSLVGLLTVEGVTAIREIAVAPGGTASYGKLYVSSGDTKIHFVTSGGTDYDLTAASSGANTSLSNLAATTAVNSTLLPGTDNSINLGSTTKRWVNLYLSGDVLNGSGGRKYLYYSPSTTDSSSSAIASGYQYQFSNTDTGVNSGVLFLNSSSAASGSISLRVDGGATTVDSTNWGTSAGDAISVKATSNGAPGGSSNYGVKASAAGAGSAGTNYGVWGSATTLVANNNYGVYGQANSNAATTNYGVYGSTTAANATAYALYGTATGTATTNYGIYATAANGTTNWAGYFDNQVGISASGYLNFGATAGSGGYGIRDNGGSIEVKTSGQNWYAPVWGQNSVDQSVNFRITGTGSINSTAGGSGLVIGNTALGTAKFQIRSTMTTAAIAVLDVPSATTLTGTLTGWSTNLATNVTATNFSEVGDSITLASPTNTGAGTYTYKGFTATESTLGQNTAAGVSTYTGFESTNPNITQTTGTVTANGFRAATGTITTGGAQNGVNVAAQGVAAGTLTGVNISAITGGAGTENAITVGTGWDAILVYNGTTVINGSGQVVAGQVTGVLPIANGGTNSSAALSGSSIMISNGTSIVQGAAGTTTTVLHGNASGAPTYGAVSLTADVTGTLPAGNGGTGISSYAIGDILYASAAGTLSKLSPGTAGYVLTTNGAGVAPSWTAAGANFWTDNTTYINPNTASVSDFRIYDTGQSYGTYITSSNRYATYSENSGATDGTAWTTNNSYAAVYGNLSTGTGNQIYNAGVIGRINTTTGSGTVSAGVVGLREDGTVLSIGGLGYRMTADTIAGVYGYTPTTNAAYVNRYGVYGAADGTGGTTNYGVYGTASGATTNWAGYFVGDVRGTTNVYFGTAGAMLAGGNQGGSIELGPTNSAGGEIPFIDFHYGGGVGEDFNMRIINAGNGQLDIFDSQYGGADPIVSIVKEGIALRAATTTNRYINMGATFGSTGYGFRDNGGTMEFKNSAGVWTAFGGGTNYWTDNTTYINPNTSGTVDFRIYDSGQAYGTYLSNSANNNKYGMYATVSQTSTTADYQNIGLLGLAAGANGTWGFSAGVMGIGNQASSWWSVGVFAGLGSSVPSLPSIDAALYADPAGLGLAAYFNGEVTVNGKENVLGVLELSFGCQKGNPSGLGGDLGLYSNGAGNWVRYVTNAAPHMWYLDGNYGTSQSMMLDSNGLSIYNQLIFPNQNNTKMVARRWSGSIPGAGTTTVFSDTYLSIGIDSSGTMAFNPNSGYDGWWDHSSYGVLVNTANVDYDTWNNAAMVFTTDDTLTTAGGWYQFGPTLTTEYTSSATLHLDKESSLVYPSYVIEVHRHGSGYVTVIVTAYYP